MKYWPLIFAFILINTSCDDKYESASESLIGEWNITAIHRSITTQSENESYTETANGNFSISENTIDYSFNLEGNLESNTFDYTLELSKENAGFTSITRYDIVGEENYRVLFGDETSDAHCDATAITLEKVEQLNDSSLLSLIVSLEKQ